MKDKSFIKKLGLIAGPALFFVIQTIPFFSLDSSAVRVIGIAVWMIIWWMTEAIPIPATALLPLILFPSLKVLTITEAASNYANSIIFLFMGGFMLALGLERHNLHKRIALNLIKLTGTGANGIILGFMVATASLSMWISNTATTVMMLPIAVSVIDLLKTDNLSDTKNFNFFALSLFLGIAYSANIGGTATIIGTPPNVVFAGYINEFYNYTIDFKDWLIIGVPFSITMIAITYILITKILYPNKLGKIEGADSIIVNQLKNLGKFKIEEYLVSIIFGLTAFLWIFKNPINTIIGYSLLNDTVTAMSGGILLFIIPSNWKKYEPLLEWSDMKKLPWGILILFGGGICLAKAMEETGIIQEIGSYVAGYPGISGLVLLLSLTTIMLFGTELMSNVALVTIFIPVVLGIADGTGTDSMALSIPVALAASCAFMMPISTPPNAIVFASGYIKMKDMLRAGLILNIVSIVVLLILSYTLISIVFEGAIK